MRLPKLRELREALRAVFSKRYTSRFPASPQKAAPGFRGKPVPDDEWCIGCHACSQVCPAEAIEIEDRGEVRLIKRLYDRCVYCGQCQELCPRPSPGVVLSQEYDMAGISRVLMHHTQEFKLIICSKCGESIATEAQLTAASEKMGPALSASSPDIILAGQNRLGITQPPVIKRSEYTRADIFVFLCPSCRHRVYTLEANR